MEIDLTPLISALIVVLLASASAFVVVKLVPEVQKLWAPFKASWPMEASFLEAQALIGVQAAFQELESASGKAKLQYVLDYVEGQAKKYGYSFDKKAVTTLIESKIEGVKREMYALPKNEKPGAEK